MGFFTSKLFHKDMWMFFVHALNSRLNVFSGIGLSKFSVVNSMSAGAQWQVFPSFSKMFSHIILENCCNI